MHAKKAIEADYGMSKAAITELTDILKEKPQQRNAAAGKIYAEDHVEE